MDSARLALVLAAAALAPFTPGLVMSPGLAFFYGGLGRSRNAVIRTGERGSAVI